MSVVFDYEGIIALIEADAFPSHVLDEWKTTLGNEQARIYARLLDVIPSFQSLSRVLVPATTWKLTGRSTTTFNPFLGC